MKRLIILAATLIAGLSACDSLLDKEPLDRVTQFDYFKTRSDLELFSNPFYDNLLDKTPYDEQNDLLVQMTLSDVLYGGDKRTVPNTGGGWSWGNLRRINTLLEYVDQCEDKKAVTEYTALAKFFRAAFYFDKVKRFGDVPWYEVQLGSADEALYKPRDSRELIMTNMIKDIDEAINSGGLTEDISTYRVNKWAALALKARFCLFEGTYRKYHGINLEGHDYTYYLEEAAKAAKTIIDEGPYKLYSTKNPDKDYMMLFAQENASTEEYILAIRNSYEAQVYHNATAYTLLPTQGRPGYTRKFINMYLMKNGTAFTDRTDGWQTLPFTEEVKDRDPRLAQSIRTPGYKRIGAKRVQGPDLGVTITGYQPIKFVQDTTASGGQIDRNDRSTCDMPVFRYAEVLLNYAEAKAELGTLTQDDLTISVNEIRNRVEMPALNMAEANKNPDWYLSSEEYGYPSLDYGELFQYMRAHTPPMEYVDITDLLSLEDYYNTDSHWRQEKILDVAQRLAGAMGAEIDGPEAYHVQRLARPFTGRYAIQMGLTMAWEDLYYLTSPTLDQCLVAVYDQGGRPQRKKVYEVASGHLNYPYVLFLSGSKGLVTVKNLQAPMDKNLILFRDSYGSSLAPLLASGYRTITCGTSPATSWTNILTLRTRTSSFCTAPSCSTTVCPCGDFFAGDP